MCGICGLVTRGEAPSGEVLRRMTDTMTLRGPDDSGVWTGGAAGLGHRRLSIIDLSSGGHQPLGNEDGTVQVVFNGEIYNFAELRRDLESRGHAFRGRSDGEVIPHAYEEWGDGFAERFRGMFAIGLWDARRARLLLVRDRLGIKPLYWYRREGLFLFASELKALRAHPAFRAAIDARALSLYLSFQYVPAPLAIYEDTRKLPPGHRLVLEGGKVDLTRWWDPLTCGPAARLDERGDGLLDRLEETLSEAVRYRLISDVPLGAFLSGGIDSSLVVALMRRMATGPVRTFTIGFREGEYDEAAWARAVAAHLGCEHTELYVTPAEAMAVIPSLPEIYDEPFGDASAIPTVLVSRLARSSVTVALSGDGGDELFCGYPRYRWYERMRLLALLPPRVRAALVPLAAALPHRKAPKAASWLGFRDALELYFGVVGIFRWGGVRELLGREEGFEGLDFQRVWEASAGRHPLERLMLVDIHTYLPDDILTKVDRASMASSLEARVPLLDHRFVELALRIPLGRKYRGGRGKLILRRLLARHLPPALFERPKMGFGVPLDHWFRGALRGLLLDQTSPARLGRDGLFDPVPVTRMVGEHLAGRRDHQYALWVLLMFQLWLERWR